MRPLVRSEQIKLRMPKSVKHMIVTRSQELGLTQTAYIERLIMADYGVRMVTSATLSELREMDNGGISASVDMTREEVISWWEQIKRCQTKRLVGDSEKARVERKKVVSQWLIEKERGVRWEFFKKGFHRGHWGGSTEKRQRRDRDKQWAEARRLSGKTSPLRSMWQFDY